MIPESKKKKFQESWTATSSDDVFIATRDVAWPSVTPSPSSVKVSFNPPGKPGKQGPKGTSSQSIAKPSALRGRSLVTSTMDMNPELSWSWSE